MTLNELDIYFKELLCIAGFPSDPSHNGIQIQNSSPASYQIKKAAFAVDACEQTMQKAASHNADILFVHHGLFWGKEIIPVGLHYSRLAMCLSHNLALYACHLPLDAHPLYGNNYGIALRGGLQNLEPFGTWRGNTIGVKGAFAQPVSIDKAVSALFPDGERPITVLPFGKQLIETAGIISGGAGCDVDQAAEHGLDLYITGELGHEDYHTALENHINAVAGGHYQTETVGVKLVMNKLHEDTGIETVFIDAPTGL